MDNLAIEALNRMKSKRKNLVKEDKKKKNVPPSKYIANLFTRTLLSVIMCLLCAIFINISDKNLIFFKDHFLNDTLAFNKINDFYTKYFGNVIPEKLANNINTIPVFENQ